MTPCICNAQYVPYLYACIILHYNICNHMHMHIGATLHTCIGSHVIQTRELYIFLTLSFSCIPENILSCVCVCMCMAGFPVLGEKGVGFGIMVVCSLTISWISIALCFLHAPSACGIQTAHLSQNEANLEKQFICFTTYISGAIIGFHVKCISYN